MKYFLYCRKSTEDEGRQVLSLLSQESEMLERARAWPDVEIVHIYRESRSAMKSGRPVFEEMLKRIEQGDAHGIVAWHPDRLSRNAFDAGRIIALLDNGILKDLRFATAGFENSPAGKLMLGVLLGFAKYYSDALGENIERGHRTKAQNGWRPGRPPLGYKTDRETHTIIPDPERFAIVQDVWHQVLSGAQSPRAALRHATAKHRLTSNTRGRRRGGSVSIGSLYRMFANPFYAGLFTWDGQIINGKHQPMVSIAEFQAMQTHLGRPGRPALKHKSFAYTGLMRCSCGMMITAEEHLKKSGKLYTYYRCTRRHPTTICKEPYVSVARLESQVVAFLNQIALAPSVMATLVSQWRGRGTASEEPSTEELLADTSKQREALDRELSEYTALRAKNWITDDEYLRHRHDAQMKRALLLEREEQLRSRGSRFEPYERLISFCNRAPCQRRSGLHTFADEDCTLRAARPRWLRPPAGRAGADGRELNEVAPR